MDDKRAKDKGGETSFDNAFKSVLNSVDGDTVSTSDDELQPNVSIRGRPPSSANACIRDFPRDLYNAARNRFPSVKKTGLAVQICCALGLGLTAAEAGITDPAAAKLLERERKSMDVDAAVYAKATLLLSAAVLADRCGYMADSPPPKAADMTFKDRSIYELALTCIKLAKGE